jgi:UDP-N-acetylmuramate dehydrogenase
VQLSIREHEPLAPLTTFRIGGPARYYAEAASAAEAIDALDFAASKNAPVFVLGGGSNILVSDRGFPGLVLKIMTAGFAVEPGKGKTFVRAGAGEEWDRLVALAVDRSLAGIECLSGIPGSVGGTPVQNVGAYGQEVSETIVSVEVLDRKTQALRTLTREECGFTYRSSIFNTTELDRYIVLRVTYELTPNGPSSLRYPEVARRLQSFDRPPTLAETRAAVREIRASKGMLIVEGDPDCRSAGSFFKNPILKEEAFRSLLATAGEDAPRYPATNGQVKTSAAWLIERAGFRKGYSTGAAAVSQKHTLALINSGEAVASDIVKLAREIRRGVEERFGVRLVPEPMFIGFDEPL